MGGTTWSIGKDTDVKHAVTRFIIEQAPDCKGKPLLLMTSRTYTDFIQLVEQGKIDGGSTVFNVENLKSPDIIGESERLDENETDRSAFSRLWEKEVNAICDSHGIGHVRHSLHFDSDILDSSLYHWAKEEPFEFVYADTCNQPTEKFFKWLDNYSTYDGIASGGSLAFTLVLERTKAMKPSNDSTDHREDFVMLGSGDDGRNGYKNLSELKKYEKWLNAIAEQAEANGKWKLERMVHYREKSENASNMVTGILRKIDE